MELDQNIHRTMSVAMHQMGFANDNLLPTANEANRCLLKEMQSLMEEREQKNVLQARLQERVSWLQDHYKNSQNEIQQNFRLIDAHRNQFDSEQHFRKLAENEHAATKKEFTELENAFAQLTERDRLTENLTVKLNQSIDEWSGEMHWMKNALTEWMQAMEQGNATVSLIQQYCITDQKRADALELRSRKLQMTILNSSMQLRDLCDTQISLEQTLDGTANLYRQRHLDRGQMVDTWRETVAALNGRDKAIRNIEEKILAAKQATAETLAELQMRTDFLRQHIQNNEEIEAENKEFTEKITRQQFELGELNDAIQLDSTEVDACTRGMRNANEKLQQMRRKNRHTIVEREAKEKAVADLNVTCQESEEKLKKMTNQMTNAQNRMKQLDDLVENGEKSLNCVEMELSRMSEMLFRSKSILQQWQNEHKLVEMEIHVLETAIKSITGNFINQEKALSKHMEMQHDAQFKILSLETRIKNLSGTSETTDPDSMKRLECMEKIFAIVSSKFDCMQKQLSSTATAERNLQNKLNESTVEHRQTVDILKECQMTCESGMVRLQQRRNELRERMVEHSLLSMRFHQMRSMFEKQAGEFFDLAVHKTQLQLAIDERIVELRSQMNILILKRKHLYDERSLLMADIGDRRAKTDGWRARFELANEMLGKNEDGSVISVVQLKIEMAQKKECLMQRGSVLNENVLAAENAIKALENTLILFNYSNDQWRRNTLGDATQGAETSELVESLGGELMNRVQKLKNIKSNIAMITELIADSQAEFIDCENELTNLKQQRFECNNVLVQCHKHILEQKTKLKRAEQELKTSRKLMMQAITDREYIRIFEKDLNAKVLELKNKSALQQIADVIDGVRGLGALIKKHLYDKGLQIPISSTSRAASTVASSKQGERSATTTLNQSRMSLTSIGHDSEYNFGVEKQKSSSSSVASNSCRSSESLSKLSTQNSRRYVPSESMNFSIDGQAIGTDKSTKRTN